VESRLRSYQEDIAVKGNKFLTVAKTSEFVRLPDTLAILYVALSVIIMAYSFLFNVFPILIFIGLWFSHLLYKRQFVLRPSLDLFIILIIPVLACYSVFWSEHPLKSLYGGTELVALALCAVIMSRLVSSVAFIQGLSVGSLVVLLATLLNGRYSIDGMGGGSTLVGLFGSKNQVGLIAEIGIISSIFVHFSNISWLRKFFISWIPMLVFVLCLYLSKSASSIASLTVVLMAIAGMSFLSRLARSARFVTLIFAFFALLTLLVCMMAFSLDMQNSILGVFGKDSTLTGRTYLWSEGIKVALEKPVLGHGFGSFWTEGNPLAERLWEKFFIPNRTGFHFHSMYVQTFVDFGMVGVAVLIALLLTSLLKSFYINYRDGMNAETGILFAFAVMLSVRSFVEVDFLGPFGIGVLLFYSILSRMALHRKIV
jgi:exopolysaccharide production protein ExoQ